MKQFLKDNAVFLSLFVIVFATMAWAVDCLDKAEVHLWLNSCHTPFGDIFCRYYTHVAEYGIYVIAFLLLFWKAGASIYLLAAEGVGAIIVQSIKFSVRAPRPKLFFDIANNPDALPLVEGVRLNSINSFPSGHSCTFFILFFALCIIIDYYRKETHLRASLYQLVAFVLALAGAFTRIYLSQHFLTDVFAGGLTGVLTVCMLYPAFLWLNNKHPKVCAWHIALPRQRKGQDTPE